MQKKIIGIIGQTGSGKTTFCMVAKKFDVFVIDADQVAHQILETDAAAELEARFGTKNRVELREIVFKNKSELSALNKITHKYIEKSIEKMIEICENNIIAIDAAILTQTRLMTLCTEIVAITATSDAQLARIQLRDKLTPHQAQSRLQSQQDDSHLADVIIENNGTYEEFLEKSAAYWRKYT